MEAGAADGDSVALDGAAALLGSGEEAVAVGDFDVEGGEAFGAAVGGGDESKGGVVEGDLGVASGAGFDGAVQDL